MTFKAPVSMLRTMLAVIAVTILSMASFAQAPVDIVTHITAGQLHTVLLPDSLGKLLMPTEVVSEPSDSDEEENPADRPATVVGGRMVGYRVQVFSDNNPRTAKNEARTKQRSVSGRFPQYRTYVSFNSPYWRLKVGDFRTQQEANSAAEELKRVFPSYSKEIRVVRDRININN